MKKLPRSIANLERWLETWKDEYHGIHGYVVHHHMDSLKVISPDTWTQSAALLGHLNLYEKTNSKKWLYEALKEGEYLVKNYIWETNYYRNSIYEHKPGGYRVQTNLIHNAYPSYALLRLCNILKRLKKDYEPFYLVAADNIDNYIIGRCWDKDNQVIKRMTNKDDKTFVLNMASVAISAIACLDELESRGMIQKYCVPTADYILKCQEGDGGFPYDDRGDVTYTLYTALAMHGLVAVYKKTVDERYLKALKRAADWLIKQIDPKTKLFYHRREGKKIVKYPEWVAGALIMVHHIKRLEEFGYRYPEIETVVSSVLEKQYETGGLPTFIGFSDIFMPCFYPPEPEIKKWRDVIAIPGWNALALECLTYMLPPKTTIPKPTIKFPGRYRSVDYIIREDEKEVIFLNQNNEVKAKWIKKMDTWIFGEIPLRSERERLLHSLYIWKKRLSIFRPLLNIMYPFRMAKPPKK